MSTSPVLSRSEAVVFLTKDDLKELNVLVTAERLQAFLDEGRSPHVVVRGKYIRLFDVLDLLGNL